MNMKSDSIIVLFEIKVKDGRMQGYLNRAAALKTALEAAPGFIRSERFSSLSTEGKLLSMSVWKDEDSIRAWRNTAAHRESQKRTRNELCEDFRITVVTPVRTYTLTDRSEAPADSNRYFGPGNEPAQS
ncbi:MAG: antibiotic biosynthesis monooxygenase family protein [Anaerovoracaceae bacterium]